VQRYKNKKQNASFLPTFLGGRRKKTRSLPSEIMATSSRNHVENLQKSPQLLQEITVIS